MYDKDFGGNDYDYGGGSSYDMGGDDYGAQPQGGGGPQMPDFSGMKAPNLNIAKYKPLIIIGIILLVIAAGVFYFISNQHAVEFIISETNGPRIMATLTISGLDGGEVYRSKTLLSNSTVTLGTGKYKVSAISSNYEPVSEEISVPEDIIDGKYNIELFKKLNASIDVSTNDITSLYGTKSIPGTLTIQNNDKEIFVGEIRAESKDIDVLFPNANENSFGITLPANGSTPITFDLEMKSSATASAKASVKFIISGTSVDETISFDANPSPEIEIGEDDLKNTKIVAGGRLTEEIEFKNLSSFAARDLMIEIVPDDDYKDKLDWFEFSPYDGEKYQAKISTLAKKKEQGDFQNIILYVQPPVSAKVNDSFIGRLILDSETLESPQTIPIQYVISKVLETSVELKTGTSPITLDELKIDKKFTISNEGDLAIEDLILKVDNLGTCDITWIRFVDDDDLDSEIEIGTLAKKSDTGDSKEINVVLLDGIPASTRAECRLVWEYSDPINQGETITNTQNYIINYTPPDEE